MGSTTNITHADQATAFALTQGLNVVSDLFGQLFVVQQEGQQAFKIARLKPTAKGGATLGSTTFKSLELALANVRRRSKLDAPTERIASLPDQTVVERYCAEHPGVKASDHVHSGYMIVSEPVRDKIRHWQVAKRVGTTLVPLEAIKVRDHWAARAAVTQLGGPEITAVLTGAIKFPYGDGYGRLPRVASGGVSTEDDKAA